MAEFYSPWYSYGSGGSARLLLWIQNPSNTTNSTQTSIARLYLISDPLFDSSNNFAMSGSLGSWSSSVNVSVGSSGTTTYIKELSKTFTMSYSSTTTVNVSATVSGLASLGTMTVSGSVTIPKRTAQVPSAVYNVQVDSITSNGCRTTWGTPDLNGSGVTQFEIAYYLNSAGTNLDTSGVFDWANNYTTTARDRATSYWVKVRARNSVGWGPWSPLVKFTTAATVPDQPTLSITNDYVTSSGARVFIVDANNGGASVTSREVRYSTSSSFTSSSTVTTTSDYADISGLTRATQYYAQTRVRNSVGWSSWSATQSFTTTATVPSAPTSVVVTPGATGSVATFSASAPADNGGSPVTGLFFQYSTSPSFLTSTTVSDSTPPYDATASGLTPGTTYYVRSYAANAIGNSTMSAVVSFTTGSGVPTAPLSVNLVNVLYDRATVDCAPPSSNGGSAITGYNIYTESGLLVAGVSMPYTYIGLDPVTTYRFRLAAVNANGVGAYSSYIQFVTPVGVPGPPGAPSITGVGANSFTVSALLPTDDGGGEITGYLYQVDTDPAFSSPYEVLVTEGDYRTHTITGLIPDTLYWVRVAAVNEAGVGEFSLSNDVDTLAGYVARTPVTVGLTATASVVIVGVLPVVVGTNATSTGVITVSPVIRVPDPLKATATAHPSGVNAPAAVSIGLTLDYWVPRLLDVSVGLECHVKRYAVLEVNVPLPDATVPSVSNGPLFTVGLEARVSPQPYGDADLDPDLKGVSDSITLDSFLERLPLDESIDGLPSVLTLEEVKGRADL